MRAINRRHFLRGALATGALLTTARSNAMASGFETARRFAPVKVARDRIIREVVGLRPYRAKGFVVAAVEAVEVVADESFGCESLKF